MNQINKNFQVNEKSIGTLRANSEILAHSDWFRRSEFILKNQKWLNWFVLLSEKNKLV